MKNFGLFEMAVVFVPIYLVLRAAARQKISSQQPPSPSLPQSPEKPLKYGVQPGVEVFTHHRKGCERPEASSTSSSSSPAGVVAVIVALVLAVNLLVFLMYFLRR